MIHPHDGCRCGSGWQVGAIDVSRIDLTWEAAMSHGFKPVFENHAAPVNKGAADGAAAAA